MILFNGFYFFAKINKDSYSFFIDNKNIVVIYFPQKTKVENVRLSAKFLFQNSLFLITLIGLYTPFFW